MPPTSWHGRAIGHRRTRRAATTQWPPLTHILRLASGGRVCARQLAPRQLAARWVARIDALLTSSTASRRTATRRCGARLFKSSRGSRRSGRDGGHLVVGARCAMPYAAPASRVDKTAGSAGQTRTSASRARARPSDTFNARSTRRGGRACLDRTARCRRQASTAVRRGLERWPGWHCGVRSPRRADSGAQATRAALFHGIVTPDDGAHAPWFPCRVRLRAAGACRAGRWRAPSAIDLTCCGSRIRTA